jgi:hypothetical protein
LTSIDQLLPDDVRIRQRFWRHVGLCDHGRACEQCCWPWLLAPHPRRGSGKFYPLVGQGITAPRFMWMLTRGVLPVERRLYRRSPPCTHAACVNPAHFYLSLPRHDPRYAEERRAAAKQRPHRKRNHDENAVKNRARRARKKNAPINDLTHAQWEIIQRVFGYRCVYCGVKSLSLTQDHLTALSNGGSHTVSNVVPACAACNSKKGRNGVLKPVQPLLLLGTLPSV